VSTQRQNLSGVQILALLTITTLLGCIGVYILSNVLIYRFPGGEWVPVKLGEDKAIRILGIAPEPAPVIYVQTETGQLQACTGDQGELFGAFAFECTTASAPQALKLSYSDSRYTPPSPPGEVRTSFVGPGAYDMYCSGQTNFVILNDGTVWSWSKVGCCEVGCLLNLIYPVGGMVLGFVVGVVIIVIYRHRRMAG
jgi:hypothetical protein